MSFEAIYRRYHQSLYRYCLTIVGNREDAQDALQNTMVKAMRALQEEKRQIKLKPWLYRIAHNESIDLLRRRRPTEALDVELAVAGQSAAETAETREQLRQLIGDLAELPDRQRGALAMRELAGLSFEQIGDAFDTSPAVARQTVYEARVSLRQMSEGRDMPCDEICRILSDADKRVLRRRDVRAHLESCASCREFRQGITTRRRDFAALSPLPAIASAALLRSLLGGGGAGASAGAGLGGTIGAGAGKAVATSAIAKSAATIAVVAAVGVGVAEQRGAIGTPLPGGGQVSSSARPHSEPQGVTAADRIAPFAEADRANRKGEREAGGFRTSSPSDTLGATTVSESAPDAGGAHRQGPPEGLPAASKHGQQTAAAHRSTGRGQSSNRGRSTSQDKAAAPHPNAKAQGKGSSPPTASPTGEIAPDKPALPPFQSPRSTDRGASRAGA